VHVAITRNASGNFALFANGSRFYSGTNAYNLGSSAAIAFGDVPTGSAGASTPPSCYMSNMRITNTAVYDPTLTSLTVPTAPLTAISGTLFLAGKDNRFVDTSSNAQTITISGTPAIVPSSPFPPGVQYGVSSVGGSYYTTASSDSLAFTTSTLAIGTGDFQIEYWWYPISTNSTNPSMITNRNNTSYSSGDWGLHCPHANYANKYSWWCYNISGGSTATLVSTSNIIFNAWTHIVVNRNSGTLRMFVNGVQEATASSSASIDDATSRGYIVMNGNASGETRNINGYMSNMRYAVGTGSATYTSSPFTLPTAPTIASSYTKLQLNGTNAGIYDSTGKNDFLTGSTATISTTQSKFGGSSMYFDGTSASCIYTPPFTSTLSPISAPGALGSGDFTIECWVYAAAASGYQTFVTNRNSAGGAGTFFFGLYAGSTSVVWYNATTASLLSSALTVNTWYHVAVSRSAGTIRMFLNGALTGTSSAADSANYSVGGLSIGYDIVEAAYPFTGYIDEFRISKYARYTSNFTPPTKAFPNQ
jgi:hypothetical protein